MEFYQGEYLDLPDDIIKIWADNGYGKMVTRKQWNHNLRILSMPEQPGGNHEIYYHVSFYDLQVSNHIIMLPNSPEFVKEELETVLYRGMNQFWIVNSSNVKPHVYYLDFIASLWRGGTIDIGAYRENYTKTYYGQSCSPAVGHCLKSYFTHAAAYSPNPDDYAGEQYPNHVTRVLVSQYMKNKAVRTEDLLWAFKGNTLKEQVREYQYLSRKAAQSYQEYLDLCEFTDAGMTGTARELFRDSLMLQSILFYKCYTGAVHICESLLHAFSGEWQKAFYEAGKARKEYLDADQAMRSRERGKWTGFYENL